jgi:RNA polymerase sigma-70 factor, ECF subfamily
MEDNFHQKNEPFSISDAELDLIKRSQNRDKLAFSELVEQHQQWLYAIAISHLRNFRDAEDVVQESLLNAWSKLSQLRDRTKFRHWMAKIVLNQCSNFRRSKYHTMIPITDLAEQEKLYIERTMVQLAQATQVSKEIKEEVGKYLDDLPKKYRTVLYLRYVSNCSLVEISRIMRISKRKVNSRINIAKRMLHRKLAYTSIDKNTQD